MQFFMMNNGIDSLYFGLEHYNKFLKSIDDMNLEIDQCFSELKFSTIAFHHAIELFTKKILYDTNELLVFSVDVSDEFIARLLHEKYMKNKTDSHMDFWIASKVEDTTYKTIDYNKSIRILKDIFKDEISNSDFDTLEMLGKMRNALTHFGYWDDFSWYKILVTINDCLRLIKSFYKTFIKKSERYFTIEIFKEIDSLLHLASKELEEVWWAAWKYQIDALADYLEEKLLPYDIDFNEGDYKLENVRFT